LQLTSIEDYVITPKSGVVLLKQYAIEAAELFVDILKKQILPQARLRNMRTPGGHKMAVAMSNCGEYGWISDAKGYRYTINDPLTSHPWPPMPDSFRKFASAVAQTAGFGKFTPDACLINHYRPGVKLSLHQDKDELDFDKPIVSVSFGITAGFLFGGKNRKDKTRKIMLEHGDVIVWGGVSRLHYHGVLPIKPDWHLLLQDNRINLTFRQAR